MICCPRHGKRIEEERVVGLTGSVVRRLAIAGMALLALTGFWVLLVGILFTAPLIALGSFGFVLVVGLAWPMLEAEWKARARERESARTPEVNSTSAA